jgi:predicted amidohydrolase YtcJ
MQHAEINAQTPDPPQSMSYAGSFERDDHGVPTGLFRDRAKELITAAIPAPSDQDEVRAITVACEAYNRVGLTGVAEPGLYPSETRAFHAAQLANQLTVRVDMLLAAWGFGSSAEEVSIKERLLNTSVIGGFGDSLLRIEGVKFMTDGGIGDRTAKVFDPYLDEPENRGQWVVDPTELPSLIRWVHDLGFSIDAHTCGDEAQELVVQAFASAQRDNPQPRLRHRVHHAYFPTEKALEAMEQHQIPAVVSNPFIANLGESFVASLGEERASGVMPMRTYLDRGIPLAGSSDSSVSDYNPWVGMHAAVARTTVTGRVLGANQAISPREALRSYTIGGAYASGRERYLGSIEPGKRADLVLLDDDPLAIDVERLPSVTPLATMLDGRWVFDRR